MDGDCNHEIDAIAAQGEVQDARRCREAADEADDQARDLEMDTT